MLYPILFKRIKARIKTALENLVINKTSSPTYDENAAWIEKYLELSDDDVTNIITKIERAQSAAIMYAMSKKDKEIFVNQLGCFYIKPTTTDFYNALERLTAGKESYDFEEVKKSALEETRDLYIKRANAKRNANKAIEIKFKV